MPAPGLQSTQPHQPPTMSMRMNLRLRPCPVAHGRQDEVQRQLSRQRSPPAIASLLHQTSYEVQPGKRHTTMLIRAPRPRALPERTDFSMFAGALQRLDLLEMKATIGPRSKPALPIQPPRVAGATPTFANTHGAAVRYPTAITQMLPTQAIHRARATAMTNFSRVRPHSSFVRFVTTIGTD